MMTMTMPAPTTDVGSASTESRKPGSLTLTMSSKLVRTAGACHELQLVISFTASLTTMVFTLASILVLMVSGELANNEVWRSGSYRACTCRSGSYRACTALAPAAIAPRCMTTHAAPVPICGCPAPPPRVLLPVLQEASCFQQIMGLQVVIFSLNNLATFIMATVIFFSFMPAIDALYRIKFAVHTNRPTILSVEQLGPYVSSFCNEFRVSMLTESSLVKYIAGTRDNGPSAKRDVGRRPSLRKVQRFASYLCELEQDGIAAQPLFK
jgi:hypothetical protein